MKTAEYRCLKCGYEFTHFDEHLEFVGPRGETTGTGCALCGGKTERIKEIEIDQTKEEEETKWKL